MKWKTKITEMIDCQYPIMSGAFAGHDNTDLVAAVSKAGGYGILTAAYFNSEDNFRNALFEIKKTTSNSFGINFSIPTEIKSDHLFYRFLKIAKEEGIKTIITAAARVREFGKQIQEHEMIWIHKVTTMKHAISGLKMGADAIILTGLEGGGLKNPKQTPMLTNMVNANKILNKVPFIASGGLSEGKGMLAALIMGAQAIHLCTAFLATTESPIPNNWKQDIVNADCFNPEIISLVCHFESDRPKSTPMSLAVGTVDKIISAGELVNNIVKEAENILKNLGFQGDLIDFS